MCFALLRKTHFSPRTKVFVCSTINTFIVYLEGGLENPRKRTETREKVALKLNFTINRAEKGQKQGRDERMQEDYRTSAAYFYRCPVVFLCSFISALFCPFFPALSILK